MADLDQAALSLELARRFAAPPERVFDAWLGEEWGEWLPPPGARCKLALIEPRVGGRFLARMEMQEGRRIEISGAYREIDRPRKLVFSWIGNHNNQETIVTITFRPDGAGTMMTLRQDGFQEAALRDGFRAGWSGPGGSFDKLDRFLQRGVA